MWWMKSFLDETQKWQTGKISKTSPETMNSPKCGSPANLHHDAISYGRKEYMSNW